jgi:hypothetical protein
MLKEPVRSRIHLLAAKEAPVLVILQRKRAQLCHVSVVNTETLQVEHGSWFRGALYPLRSDVSFDGQHMVYMALGRNGRDSWSGVCCLPWLTTLFDENCYGRSSGGCFTGRDALQTHWWGSTQRVAAKAAELPFIVTPIVPQEGR